MWKNKIIKNLHEKSHDVYLLHKCVYYIHFTVILTHCLACMALFSFFAKIIVALDSSYINTYKTTPNSSFYTVYCQRYSDFKTFGDRWRPS